jgi:23S rRNA (cytidine1920-2'-O)/16S rRNA (cytidine1409-2'-O)-methyltransferase
LIAIDVPLEIASRRQYVSRGGDKLASVADRLHLNFQDHIVLDVGSSTGGFTDYALQHGAARVYAVDVGTAQLAYKLRQNPRVVVMEKTDIRQVEATQLEPVPTVAVIDVSFISLLKVLPAAARLLTPTAQIIAMMKPQFESDKATADRYKGVIKDDKVRQSIIDRFEEQIAPQFTIAGVADSSVRGAEGNRERFYLLAQKS